MYYLLSEFNNTGSSEIAYSNLLKQNQSKSGFLILNEIENQAFMHTDHKNFVLITSKKENKILVLKVNKITSRTSLKELQNVSKEITAIL